MNREHECEQPWEQQPGEAARAYEAARLFFELGPQRSVKTVALKLGKPVRTMHHYARRYRWNERAQAYDRHFYQIRQEQQEKVVAQRAEEEWQRWSQRMYEGREHEWEVSRKLLARAREVLEASIEEMRWSPRDVATCSSMAAQLLRQAASDTLQQSGTDQAGETVIRVEYVE
jgi:hypothetical protein